MHKYLITNKKVLFKYILIVPLLATSSVLFAKSLQPLLDIIYSKDRSVFFTYSIIALSLGVIDMLIFCLHKIFRERLRCEFISNMKEKLFNGILLKDIPDFNTNNTSHYLSIVSRDIRQINSGYFDSICGIYRVTVSFFITFGVLLFINPWIACLNLFVGILSVSIPKIFQKKLIHVQNRASLNSEKYINGFKDYLNGFSTIKLFHIQKVIKSKMQKSNWDQEYSNYRSISLVFSVSWISILCSQLSYILTIVVGIWMVLEGKMTVGSIVAISQLIGGIVSPLEELPTYITELKSIKGIIQKIEVIINSPQKTTVSENKAIKNYDLLIKNVSYSYQDNNLVIDNIDLKLEEGKHYVIIGESGSGKSTLAKIIMGFYKVNDGSIKLGDVAINQFPESQLYQLISYMQQDTFLFSDTLYNNITLYQNYSNEKVIQAVKDSGLQPLVEELPLGLETIIDENGNNFSGGERQRIGLARALLCGARFIIFDELTSNMDVVLENKIENTILSLKNTGSLIITHKLNDNLLKNCDGIIVMKDGQIVEQGQFNELIQEQGYFYNYYSINHNVTTDII